MSGRPRPLGRKGGGSLCKRLSRLKARFPDQLGATGALLLEILCEVLRRVENRIDSDIGEARFTKVGRLFRGVNVRVPIDDHDESFSCSCKAPAARAMTAFQSAKADCRKTRAVGYQGVVLPSRIQRQSGANGAKTQTGRPIAPARCAGAVSTVMRRSHSASTAAVSLKSASSPPR